MEVEGSCDRNCYEARRIAANIAKLLELLKRAAESGSSGSPRYVLFFKRRPQRRRRGVSRSPVSCLDAYIDGTCLRIGHCSQEIN